MYRLINTESRYSFELDGRILKIILSKNVEPITLRKSVIVDYDLNGERAYTYIINKDEIDKLEKENNDLHDLVLINYVNKKLISDVNNWAISCLYIITQGPNLKLCQKVDKYKIVNNKNINELKFLRITEKKDGEFELKITSNNSSDTIIITLHANSREELLDKLNINYFNDFKDIFNSEKKIITPSFNKEYTALYFE